MTTYSVILTPHNGPEIRNYGGQAGLDGSNLNIILSESAASAQTLAGILALLIEPDNPLQHRGSVYLDASGVPKLAENSLTLTSKTYTDEVAEILSKQRDFLNHAARTIHAESTPRGPFRFLYTPPFGFEIDPLYRIDEDDPPNQNPKSHGI